jgi:hypothetical protein
LVRRENISSTLTLPAKTTLFAGRQTKLLTLILPERPKAVPANER